MPQLIGSDVPWAKHTTLHPVALVILIALAIMMLAVRRQYATWPIILLCCFVPSAQRIVVAGADFTFLRLLMLVGWIRVSTRSEWGGVRWRWFDTIMVAWAVVGAATYTLLWSEPGALLNQLGECYDSLGLYFLFRCFIHDWEDVSKSVLGFVVASVPVMFFFLIEWSTGKNMFAFFGSIPYDTIVRDGRFRCQGAFAHPILAGCFWASMMPMMGALCFKGGLTRVAALVGLFCSSVVIIACASSTPMVAVALGVFGAGCFLLRNNMRFVCLTVLAILIALHLSMQQPVWHLLSRIDLTGGSTGWQRFYLVDQTIRRVGQWWLLGVRTTADWGAGLLDITNQFVKEAISGGMLRLVLFVTLIVMSFRNTGRAWRNAMPVKWEVAMAWALGVAIFVHISNFLAVTYFGQIIMVWYLHLAMIANLSLGNRRNVLVAKRPGTGNRAVVLRRMRRVRPPRDPNAAGPATSPGTAPII